MFDSAISIRICNQLFPNTYLHTFYEKWVYEYLQHCTGANVFKAMHSRNTYSRAALSGRPHNETPKSWFRRFEQFRYPDV